MERNRIGYWWAFEQWKQAFALGENVELRKDAIMQHYKSDGHGLNEYFKEMLNHVTTK